MKTHVGYNKEDACLVKGVGILMMLFHHLYLNTSRFKGISISFAPFDVASIVNVANMLKICVGVFAFVSGYGLFLAYKKDVKMKQESIRWFKKRTIQLILSFFFCYIICYIVSFCIDARPLAKYYGEGVVRGVIQNIIDSLGLAKLFSTPTMNGGWWYISAAILYMTVLPFIFLSSEKIGYFPIIVMMLFIPRLIGTGYPGDTNPFSFILSFVIGMIAADYHFFERFDKMIQKSSCSAFLIWGGMFVMLCVHFFFTKNKLRKELWDLEFTLMTFAWVVFINYGLGSIKWIRKPLIFLGNHSLTIWLTHGFIRGHYAHDFIYGFKHFFVIFFVLLGCSAFVAIILDSLKSVFKYDKLSDLVIRKVVR